MTAHQLAQKLLDGPDLPVAIYMPEPFSRWEEADDVKQVEAERFIFGKEKSTFEKYQALEIVP